jgi:excisionase family DNA binding protein
MDEVADKVAARLQAMTPPPAGDSDKELLTPKEVAALFSVTNKTLHVWNKTGFLPRIRIGGVVRYRRADVERAAQVKGKSV